MTGIIVLCRYSSSRLPGKILKKIDGKPLIEYIIDRLQFLRENTPIVVCTSLESSDDKIEEYCKNFEIDCFRGSLKNVSERFLKCAQYYHFNHAVRINGDNIFLDSELIEKMILRHTINGYGFSSNVHLRTFPKGMSVEIVDVNYYAKSYPYFEPEDMEHVMTYFYRQDGGNHFFLYNTEDLGKTLNFAIDTQQDFDQATKVIGLMEKEHIYYKMKDIISLYKKAYEKE